MATIEELYKNALAALECACVRERELEHKVTKLARRLLATRDELAELRERERWVAIDDQSVDLPESGVPVLVWFNFIDEPAEAVVVPWSPNLLDKHRSGATHWRRIEPPGAT